MERRMIYLIHGLILQISFAYASELSFANTAEELISNPCTFLLTCGKCLTLPSCSWCLKEDYERGAPRCNTEDKHLGAGCSEEDIVNPASNFAVLENIELSDARAVAGASTQLKPQRIRLKLRPNQPVSFTLSFRQAEDYPVDLYYLMDLTWSMKEHKDKLAQLAGVLADSMFNITKNFQLGFGSFIDKVVMPYASMVPARLKNPCGEDFDCSSPYGFQNHLSLTSNVSAFIDEVSNASLSANLDNAEGGFDAVMQVIVCKEHIKWHNKSRKIILFATDSIFHYAGDGLLGGIVNPNDGNCHLDEDGFYTYSLYQDYPTLSQINKKLTDNNINIIFAVPEEKSPLYKLLSSHIEGSYSGKLLKDSSNIVHLIKDQYNAIRSKVELKDTSNKFKSDIKVQYFSKCLGDDVTETNVCENLTVGTTVEFGVKVELTSCPKNRSLWESSMRISPVGLQEYVEIDLELICECECEKPENQVKLSEKCSTFGTYACGICTCEKNYFGRECECPGDNAIQNDKLALCRKTNTSRVCSGKGECVCGVCDCYSGPGSEKIFGQYCECDTYSCDRDAQGRVCGGEGRGRCCGECICEPSWSGKACDCTTDQSNCIAVSSGDESIVCSGHGECVCGKCQCYIDEGQSYSGPFCEDCSICKGLCTEIQQCVECHIFKTFSLNDSNCETCTYNITTVDEVEVINSTEKKCLVTDDAGCSFVFKYLYNEDNEFVVFVQENKVCPIPANIAIVGGSIAGGVFLIGIIAVLIIRFCIYLKDKKDWEKFQDEVKRVQWGEETNPLYKKAVSKYQNPMYNPKDKDT